MLFFNRAKVIIEIQKKLDLERLPIDGLSTCSCTRGIATLNDEFGHHSVKYCAIVVTWSAEQWAEMPFCISVKLQQ